MTVTDSKILAVVAGVDASAAVLEAAVERADAESASLVVLHVMPEEVYEGRSRPRVGVPELTYDGFTFTLEQATESAESVAERAIQAAIGDEDVSYIAVGRVGDFVSTVLEVAATHGCDTILLQETYPRWRRVVGRAGRRLAKRFDGTVVRVPRPFPQNLKTTRQLPQS